ncbi:MAG: SdrD B-like domain-containing protein, partial [Acidobacteriota bacterium]
MTSHARARLFARVLITLLVAWGLALGPASAQRIIFSKGANGINPDGTVDTGTTFSYRIPYNCNAVVGDCEGVRIIDLLPAGVQFVGAIGNSDVATINAPSSGTVGTGMPGGPQIEFVFIDPLPAGNSGDLTINVRFPNGSTPDGFVATNTAEVTGTNLTNDGEVSNPVDVTALADLDARVVKTLQTNPANLNQPVTYRVRVEVVNDPGNLNLGDISVVDTLPPGVTFLSATSGGVYDPVGETVTWAGPFTATVGSPLNLFVTVQYDTPTFTDGQNVTNSATATGTPLGGAPQGLGVGDVTHPVITFTPNASVNLDKRNGSGFNFPPGVGQDFPWDLEIRNNGNVPVDDLTMIDTIPDEVELISVATGAYNNPSATVAVSYTTNLNAVFQPWGSSPGGTSATFTVASLGLGAGEYVDQVRWAFGTAPVGMAPTNGNSRARITVRSIDPDRLGGPVGDGTTIENCASATWTFMAAPGSDMDCSSTTLDGLYTLSQPRKEERTSSPYTPGATVSFRLRVNNRSQATAALPTPIVTDLLPRELTYTPTTFSYDDRGTGVAAPTFEELPNYNGTERTLLRWTFADDLAPGDEVWIEFDTTLAVGARFGTVTNTFGQTHNDPGLSLRCTGSTRAADALDLDGDGDTTDFFCNDGENLSVAPVAQLASEKLVRGQCDTIFTKTPQFGVTFPGGFLDYRFTVRNIGTVAAEDFTIVDLLPRVGDTGVLDTTPRLSGWSPFLAEPITPPPNAVVFYSTADNPCRPEVGGPSTGCDAPNWSTIPPVPISATRAFRITFERTVLEPEDILTFDLRMIAPADAPITADTMNPMPNDIAWNSFAYLGQRSDGAGSLNAEPNKVGIVVKAPVPASLGDFVWLDTNGDGVQNDGPTGVNDVRVELYDLGPDGLPNSGDENLLGTTLTADDAAGDPGWYTFTGLSAGDYTVCFVPPPNFLPTTPDQGGSDAFDSDVDPMTLCTPPIMLPGGAVDPDWDFGLLPPTTASLGNYAWFDDNA